MSKRAYNCAPGLSLDELSPRKPNRASYSSLVRREATVKINVGNFKPGFRKFVNNTRIHEAT